MCEFTTFAQAMQDHFKSIESYNLFFTDMDKDKLWELYLSSFPEGTNPIFRERTEHDCQCCKQFIRAMGNVVALVGNKIVSIWDIPDRVDIGFYREVANTLGAHVKQCIITGPFYYEFKSAGTKSSTQILENGDTLTFNHFYQDLPEKVYKLTPSKAGQLTTTFDVLKRGLTELKTESLEIIRDLIAQKSLYRGDEFSDSVENFYDLKKCYEISENKELFLWDFVNVPHALFRNTVIGTLAVDLSNGEDLDKAVRSFESKVAPVNYKRTSALITQSMIDSAKKKVDELGLTDALSRRFAKESDLTINNIIFADRSISALRNDQDDPFSSLSESVKQSKKNFSKVEEIGIEDFITNIVPNVDTIELLVQNQHSSNFFSLVAPVDPNAGNLFKWCNNFSWAYTGDVTDSIKEKVKRAGGNVEGHLRCSLSWFNYDDLDLHVIEPDGNRIWFSRKKAPKTGGELDIDMNVGPNSRSAVENIFWKDKNRMLEGEYQLIVNNYNKRESIDVGFDVEIDCEGKVFSFHYDKPVCNSENVEVAKFEFTRDKGVKIIRSIPEASASKNIFGIDTESFHKVKLMLFSPNHWDDKTIGNLHYMFVLENCKNDQRVRGFFNEYLRNDLNEHRKVFEILGSKMMAEPTDDQLSGVGFSSTSKNSIICKVSGSFTRVLKINF